VNIKRKSSHWMNPVAAAVYPDMQASPIYYMSGYHILMLLCDTWQGTAKDSVSKSHQPLSTFIVN
jgi:hypothetical protein